MASVAESKQLSSTDKLPSLTKIFDSALKKHELINESEDPTNSVPYQELVSEAISLLEQATHMVNDLALFSSNEQIDEIATTDLRYLLLPSLLGDVSMKLMSDDRLEVLETGQAYFIDYLKRCKDYTITNQEIPTTESADTGVTSPTVSGPGRPDMKAMQADREAKIKKFKEKKERERKMKEMGTWLQIRDRDDEVQREYYKLMLESWVDKAIEELKSIAQEKQILQHMAKVQSTGHMAAAEPDRPAKTCKPMKPFIITRDAVQAKVFGAGYPSLPTVSLEEFFEKEIREGKIPQEALHPSSVVVEHGQQDDKPQEAEDDEDDPEAIKKARELDDWKDDHKRGWGNRYNRS
ncbi:immunoglobulin-binding protein 1-like [Anneissia japonica]|uniref:immunoglobulin-binding protein 1-like n=1 Tax=Anneissia japonica TaxID=1529436 RepID=UPI00142590D2|nr:immunoglobulin-binding protein 1-like [Anneissia japonica]